MNIFTYYDDIGFDNQNRILDLWKKNWSSFGFNPVVLSNRDAQKHQYFKEFCQEIRSIYKRIKGENISKYDFCCHLRWLAYAAQKNAPFLVSDYDVFNSGFSFELFDKYESSTINFLNNQCPCIAYGSPPAFEMFAKDIIKISQDNVENIKKISKDPYHDQEFISCNYTILKDKYTFSQIKNIIHYSHHEAYKISEMAVEEIRIHLITRDFKWQ